MSGCAFCDIVAGRAPAWTVLEDDGFVAFLDSRPVFEGHCLLVPVPTTRPSPTCRRRWWDRCS